MLSVGMMIGLFLSATSQTSVDWSRLYYEVTSGRVDVHQLSQRQIAGILAYAENLKEQRDPRNREKQCVEREIDRIGRPLTSLDQRIIDLKCSPAR
jgi:hypothetical protein